MLLAGAQKMGISIRQLKPVVTNECKKATRQTNVLPFYFRILVRSPWGGKDILRNGFALLSLLIKKMQNTRAVSTVQLQPTTACRIISHCNISIKSNWFRFMPLINITAFDYCVFKGTSQTLVCVALSEN